MSAKVQYRRINLEINLKHLKYNFAQIKQHFKQQKILCVIKNNAYGHGIYEISKHLNKADYFGVADITEATRLRAQGISTALVVMGGIWTYDDFVYGAKQNILFIVYEKYQLEIIKKYEKSTSQPYSIWLKVDTGMNRLGIPMKDSKQIIESIATYKYLSEIVIMTHFANADNLNEKAMKTQLKNWDLVLKDIQVTNKSTLITCANSSMLLNYPKITEDIIRPGLMLYGVYPETKNAINNPFDLKPVMSLKSNIISIKHVAKGETVGYGSRWTAEEESIIAIVPIGYGDGYFRYAKDGTPVLIKDQRAYLAGRVSMNMISIDVTHLENIKIGDEVTLWGDGLRIEEIEQMNGASSYDMLISAGSKAVAAFI